MLVVIEVPLLCSSEELVSHPLTLGVELWGQAYGPGQENGEEHGQRISMWLAIT